MEFNSYLPSILTNLQSDNPLKSSLNAFNQAMLDLNALKGFMDYKDNQSVYDLLKIKETTYKTMSVSEPAFAKSLFLFKGTSADLNFVAKQLGYEAIVYNDGGYIHRDLQGVENVIEVISGYKERTQYPCGIEIKVVIDLNNNDFSYDGVDTQLVRELCEARLSNCTYLAKIMIELSARESFATSAKLNDFLEIKISPAVFVDRYMSVVTKAKALYGKQYNANMKYGTHLNDNAVFGEKQTLSPVFDKFILGQNTNTNDSANILDNISDFASIEVVKACRDSVNATQSIKEHLTIKYTSQIILNDLRGDSCIDTLDYKKHEIVELQNGSNTYKKQSKKFGKKSNEKKQYSNSKVDTEHYNNAMNDTLDITYTK